LDRFDYVVVGAGSAGCVVASRLTEDPNVSVLLLEAGTGDDLALVDDPRAFVRLFKTPQDWCFVTTPEPELNGRCIDWPRGKVLGGTSAMNAMIYLRGNRADYDHWASLGNSGWGFNQVLPYFIKSERNSRGASKWHGGDGPLDVTDATAPHPYSRAFVEAAVELGHASNPDFNAARQEGAGLLQRTVIGTTRASAAGAFLHPASARKNLHIMTHAMAACILFTGKRATGVRYTRGGMTQEVAALREVIVCGGTINAPQLLMLSGIGPADHLHSLGITVVADVPGVGRNLQDHPKSGVRCWTSEHHPVDALSNQVEAGLLCNLGRGCDAPELYFHFLPVAMIETHEGKERSALAIAAVVLRPDSRGSIELQSADPDAKPVIRPGYYSEGGDLDLLVEGVKIARSVTEAGALARICVEESLPGPGVNSDADLEDYVRVTSDTIFHPVGTCKMGTDDQAVVDPQLRVRGVESLRVIDASIMPTITSSPTNAPAIMIGEKGADMIRAPD